MHERPQQTRALVNCITRSIIPPVALPHFLVPFSSCASGIQSKTMVHISSPFPFCYTSHCLYSILIATNKAPVGALMYVKWSHCKIQSVNQSISVSRSKFRVCAVVLSSFLSIPLFSSSTRQSFPSGVAGIVLPVLHQLVSNLVPTQCSTHPSELRYLTTIL